MAYNLQSLITILQQILHQEQTHWTFDHNKPQLESLLQKAESLMQILEKSSHTKIASLESQIRDTVYKAEDIIESQMVHQMLSNPDSESLTFSTPNLQQVTQELDSAMVFLHDLTPDLQQATQQLESMKLVEELEEKKVCASPQLMSLARSFICTGKKIASTVFSMLRLVRVLDVMGIEYKEFPEEILQLINLRYLAFSCTSGLPIGISRLWYLQTLICKQVMMLSLPSEIWEMSELRHLRSETISKIGNGYKIRFVHTKLQTIFLVWITPSLIRSGFFEIIPNIIWLGIYYIHSPDIEVDLSHLHKLENLRCQSELDKVGSCFLIKLRFPYSIRKLTIVDCVLFRRFLTTLCALPNLEVLYICRCVFERDAQAEEEEWEVTEGDEFRSLQHLNLQLLNIVRWRAKETNFPKLRELHVVKCNELEEIPCDIGDIPTLQEIYIHECGTSVIASALQIQKVQQEEYDNYDLKVLIEY
ncbi:hypothetical protein SASPL_149621 [Salvia splendens]|uniref:Disease resistance R13L4/SHOC-2-like LRR domain-containing protein n=1 Tax=Salvia splendens TaxID=180675 RepID=A0A8X8WB51_SALSN|nr:hypothetical protein SASPL_149621 [Salvia splendens]